MRVIGCMSGTSADAIDVAAIEATINGPELRCAVLGHRTVELSAATRKAYADLLPPAAVTAERLGRFDTAMGHAFAGAAQTGLRELAGGAADLVVISGQTVFHDVVDGVCLGTLQLGQPAWVAERTGLPVISDIRSKDVAAGGQGAPLVSLLDALLLGDRPGAAALNLGGIANVTVFPDGRPLAFDTGPANALMDAAMAWRTDAQQTYDRDGSLAAAGTIDGDLLDRLLAEPYLARPAPKSTGKELFHLAYLQAVLGGTEISTEDLLATLLQLTARSVADALRPYDMHELLVSGGGSRNPTLMAAIATLLPGVSFRRPEELGLPEPAKEAVAFALIGLLTVHGLPGALPSATGARHPALLGSLTPGTGPLRLPPPAEEAPTRLVLDSGARTPTSGSPS